MAQSQEKLKRRRNRVRRRLKRAANGKPRFSVFRSGQNIYAQIIDDVNGVTLVQASTADKELRPKVKSGSNVQAAAQVGKLVAERATKAGIDKVVFDRGSYLYHGRVRSLAEAAREAGLKF